MVCGMWRSRPSENVWLRQAKQEASRQEAFELDSALPLFAVIWFQKILNPRVPKKIGFQLNLVVASGTFEIVAI